MQPQDIQAQSQDLKQAPQLFGTKPKSNQEAGIAKID